MTTIKEYFKKRKEDNLKKKLEFKEKQLKKKQEEAVKIKEAEAKAKEIPKETEVEVVSKPAGLRDQIKDLNEKLDSITQETKVKKHIKKKSFKLPYKVKSQLKKLALKGKIQAILMQYNGNLKPIVAEVKSGMLAIDGKVYDGGPKYVWFWNGKFPTMLIPEWDLTPISREDLYNDATDNKRLSDPQTLIIRAMEWKEAQAGKTVAGKTWIWFGIGIIAVLYIIFGQS